MLFLLSLSVFFSSSLFPPASLSLQMASGIYHMFNSGRREKREKRRRGRMAITQGCKRKKRGKESKAQFSANAFCEMEVGGNR